MVTKVLPGVGAGSPAAHGAHVHHGPAPQHGDDHADDTMVLTGLCAELRGDWIDVPTGLHCCSITTSDEDERTLFTQLVHGGIKHHHKVTACHDR